MKLEKDIAANSLDVVMESFQEKILLSTEIFADAVVIAIEKDHWNLA